jgi:hypothetical protein
MRKVNVYWTLAMSMALLGLAEAVSGFVLWLGFPAGGGGGRGWGGGGLGNLTFWELSRHTWTDIHDWVAVALVVIVTIHVIMHWKWIVRIARSLSGGTPKKLAADLVKID